MSENTQKESFWTKALTHYIEAKEAAVDRFKMPIATFYISLLIITYWEPLLILIFSAETAEHKAAYVKTLYASENEYYHYIKLIRTLALGYAFSVIFPLLTQSINYLTKSAKNADLNAKDNLKERIRLDEEKQALHDFKKANIKSGQLEKDQYNKTIEDLKLSYEGRISSLVENHETETKNLKETNTSLQLQIKQIEKQLLEYSKSTSLFGSVKHRRQSIDMHVEAILANFNREPLEYLINKKDDSTSKLSNKEISDDLELNDLVHYFSNNSLAFLVKDVSNQINELNFTITGNQVIDKIKTILNL